jgi:hypothetical protein
MKRDTGIGSFDWDIITIKYIIGLYMEYSRSLLVGEEHQRGQGILVGEEHQQGHRISNKEFRITK